MSWCESIRTQNTSRWPSIAYQPEFSDSLFHIACKSKVMHLSSVIYKKCVGVSRLNSGRAPYISPMLGAASMRDGGEKCDGNLCLVIWATDVSNVLPGTWDGIFHHLFCKQRDGEQSGLMEIVINTDWNTARE